MNILANDFSIIFESPDPQNIFCYSPGIAVLSSGRIVATMEISSFENGLIKGVKTKVGSRELCGKVFTSDDNGMSWQHREDFPISHARPFVSGDSMYIIGQAEDLFIIRSDDDGETWTKPHRLTDGEKWHQAPCNVHYANENVYLVMEKMAYDDILGWQVNVLAPILMRGKVGEDLTKRENWTFATEFAFRDIVDEKELDYHGIPFYSTPPKANVEVAPGRACAPIGWLETNVVQFTDPNHYFYDPDGRTFHLWMRAHTGGTGYACIAKVQENNSGRMVTMLEQAPSGKKMLFVPCPGGQMKFHILYDEQIKLYWLLSTQATDSMTRAEKLDEERYNLPNNERDRLQLHFSKNCIDWCFAGLVTKGDSPKKSRHYASMAIDGDDLYILSRSGDEKAKSAHNGNIITFHTIRNFRDLVY